MGSMQQFEMAVFGRPCSDITRAVRDVAPLEPVQAATWLDLARRLEVRGLISTRARSELVLVRNTVFNLARRGELRRVGRLRVPGAMRPMSTFVATPVGVVIPAGPELAQVMRSWVG